MRAFLVGAGLMLIGAKFWVFTLGAIAAIGDADLSRTASIGTYLLFVALTVSIHLALIGIAFAVPSKADALLERAADWLSSHNRLIVITLGLVFGTWFAFEGTRRARRVVSLSGSRRPADPTFAPGVPPRSEN